ncbi:MAG: group II intron reverse transcriptase domain-containing protein [Clostridia bacterium]|nr:group II intron reverse transcriptase domain-containing protein [Clostridia bacterium]
MSLLDRLKDPAEWQSFYEYRCARHLPKQKARELASFIENKEYLPVCERIRSGARFPLPKKSVISKSGSSKKRVVYTYPRAENNVLKLLTHLILRKYNGIFDTGLYSFRPGRSAKDAVDRLMRIPCIGEMYSYKADISNYFNSIDISLLLPLLGGEMADDPELLAFLTALLSEQNVLFRGEELCEQKGIMAGTPLASFFANLFLRELDHRFYEHGAIYFRYSDDIIVFARTPEQLAEYVEEIKAFLSKKRLAINPSKEFYSRPGEKWTFLGFSYLNGKVDIAPVSVDKIKGKMRRKARALTRWQQRRGLGGEKAAKAFIRVFNRKLFEYTDENDMTWTRWFFPVISTVESLREIDRYAEDCIRFIISETHTKARFNVRYEDMKRLGFRSLVHEYYASIAKPEEAKTPPEGEDPA